MKKSILAILGTFLLSQVAFGAPPLVVSKGKLWKDRNINIAFVSGTSEERELVKKFAMPWSKYANLNFHFFDSLSEAPGGRAHIRVQISERNGANPFAGDSYVGTDSLYSGTGYSMRIFIKPDEMMYLLRGVVLHEFGHALGLNHEHQHPERTYEFNEAKLQADCAKRGISYSQCDAIYTKTFSRWENSFLTYDPDSIMHYSLDRNYIKTGPEEILNAAADLSLLDKIGIARIYPGKISEEEIMAEHEAERSSVEETESVKGCRMTSFTSGGKAFYSYNNRETNFYLGFGIGTKQGAIINAELDPNCDAVEIEEVETEERKIKSVEVDTSDRNETKIKTIYFPDVEEEEKEVEEELEEVKIEKCALVLPGEKTGKIYIDTYTVTMNWYVVADSKKQTNMTGTGFQDLDHAQRVMELTEACQ